MGDYIKMTSIKTDNKWKSKKMNWKRNNNLSNVLLSLGQIIIGLDQPVRIKQWKILKDMKKR